MPATDQLAILQAAVRELTRERVRNQQLVALVEDLRDDLAKCDPAASQSVQRSAE